MKKKALSEFVVFTPGINPARLQKQTEIQVLNYYDAQSFEADYYYKAIFVEDEVRPIHHISQLLEEGDVIINNSLQLATEVGKGNVGKVLTLNFTKVDFMNDQLDKRYFLFLFNLYKDVRRQKEKESQGSGLVQRITIRSLEEIVVPIVLLKEQKKIGAIYEEVMKLKGRLSACTDLVEQFANSIIEETLKEK